MKSIKVLGTAAVIGLTAIALIAASSAIAGSTQLCKTDPNPCGSAVTHVHETSVSFHILTPFGNILCIGALFLSTSVGALAAPQVVKGNFTYSNCARKKIFGGEEACTVTEINGPAELRVLKTGHETASVTGYYELSVVCGGIIDCVYSSQNITATAKGPLLSTRANGEVVISGQTLDVVTGTSCPEAKLDITTTPLEATYIST